MRMEKINWESRETVNFYLNVNAVMNIKLITEGLVKYLEDILEGDITNEEELFKEITN